MGVCLLSCQLDDQTARWVKMPKATSTSWRLRTIICNAGRRPTSPQVRCYMLPISVSACSRNGPGRCCKDVGRADRQLNRCSGTGGVFSSRRKRCGSRSLRTGKHVLSGWIAIYWGRQAIRSPACSSSWQPMLGTLFLVGRPRRESYQSHPSVVSDLLARYLDIPPIRAYS